MRPLPRVHTRLVILLIGLPWTAVAVAAAERAFVVDPAASRVRIQVGKAGIASFAGHEHEVLATALTGTVIADPEDPSRARVELKFEASALKVTGRGEPAADVPKVQEIMLGPAVLDVVRFPAVVFSSRRVQARPVSPGVYEVEVMGELSLHGLTRSLTVPVRVEVGRDTLTASGRTVLRQKDFGISPISAGGGTVKVKNELAVEFSIVGRIERVEQGGAAPPPP